MIPFIRINCSVWLSFAGVISLFLYMLREETIDAREPMLLVARLRDYAQLMKPNLSFMVVFSSVVGYLLAPGIAFAWAEVLLLFTGGMLVTSGANTINQILERNSDRFMKRTAQRPLPDGRMGTTEAWIIVAISGIAGAAILGYYFNWAAAGLSVISLLIYGFAYTPLKKIHPIATFVGAIPGALPPLIGWVAATGSFGIGGWVLFLIQFFWQFPHFWAIAWVGYEDYIKAGIRMLPSREGKTRFTGLQCMFYSIVLIPLCAFPRIIGISGNTGMYVSMMAGALYFGASIVFYIRNDHISAKRLMFASFIYLPVVLLALLFSKI
jgi:protoheme IX farnesyltransferase